MRTALLHLILCAVAAATPLLAPADTETASLAVDEPTWPSRMDGRVLVRQPAAADDVRFVGDTGGHVARFSDGTAEVLVRWSAAPTRHLHPSAICFESLGWTVTRAPRRVDSAGRAWTAYTIERDGVRRTVTERVEDATGRSWADPVEWYWAALLGRTSGPAFAYTVVRDDVDGRDDLR